MRTKTKPCGRCKETLELEAFAPSQRRKLSSWCMACRQAADRERLMGTGLAVRATRAEHQALRREECQRHVLAHLEAHPCVDCGERDVAVLQFDHVRGAKRNEVAVLISHSIRALEAEIAKCEVRCGNCHRRKTIRERGHWLLAHARPEAEEAP